MLKQRLHNFVEPLLGDQEQIVMEMAGFRPLTRSAALVAIFPTALGGLAAGGTFGVSAWLGGAVGAGLGAGLAMLLDQRRARAEHGGKSLAIGLVVTNRRLFILDLDTGAFRASVKGVHLEENLTALRRVETDRMQGSGLKRVGVVLDFGSGEVERVIPARTTEFLKAIERS